MLARPDPTETEAVLWLLVPALEPTVTVLSFWPGLVPTTLSEVTQSDDAPIDPPVRLRPDDPGIAVAVPPQVLLSPVGEATTSPLGRLSAKLTPVISDPF